MSNPSTHAQIICPLCGIPMVANDANMCLTCLRANVDIADGLIKEYTIHYCPECERYLQPPQYWSKADPESKELMVICLKKIKGLKKFTLIDATFLWTEAHSKRLRVRVVLQKEVFTQAVIQQTVVIEYVIHWKQCDRCARVATGQPQWAAVVQLRQQVAHKRTFLYLEQLILKHRMHENSIKIETHPFGLDFFFGHKSHAMSFMDFISRCAPVTRTDAVQLVSHDSKSNTAIEHHTFSLQIAPICREDLVCLPPTLRKKMGGIGPLVLAHKINANLLFMDPRTLQTAELLGNLYWKSSFPSLATTRNLTEFFVVDVELLSTYSPKYQLACVTVEMADRVGNGEQFVANTHLGRFLKPGDSVKGYFLHNLNYNNEYMDQYTSSQFDDVILVRKHYPNQVRRRRKRQWKMQQLEIAEGSPVDQGAGKRQRHQPQTGKITEEERDEFYDEVERNKELRSEFTLYKRDNNTVNDQEASDGEAVVELNELIDQLDLNDSDSQDGCDLSNDAKNRRAPGIKKPL